MSAYPAAAVRVKSEYLRSAPISTAETRHRQGINKKYLWPWIIPSPLEGQIHVSHIVAIGLEVTAGITGRLPKSWKGRTPR